LEAFIEWSILDTYRLLHQTNRFKTSDNEKAYGLNKTLSENTYVFKSIRLSQSKYDKFLINVLPLSVPKW